MANTTLKAGQITAKLRDAVPVEFYQDGSKMAQYKNIDIPDSLKELDITDFGFITPESGKISFRLHFAPGVLPTEFPPAREKLTRAEKAAAKATTVNTADLAAAAAEALTAITGDEVTATPADEDTAPAPAIPEYRFNVTGARRKELAEMLAALKGAKAKYLGAPSFAYAIGEYRISKPGTITGELSAELLALLAEQGFTPEENGAE